MSNIPVTDKTQSAIFKVLNALNTGEEPECVDIEIAMDEIVRLRKLCEKKDAELRKLQYENERVGEAMGDLVMAITSKFPQPLAWSGDRDQIRNLWAAIDWAKSAIPMKPNA